MTEPDLSAILMEDIRQRFLRRLQDWLPMFEVFYAAMMKSDLSDELLENIKTKVHKIGGSARTFGFSSLNIHAEHVEHNLNEITGRISNKAVSYEQGKAFQNFYNEAVSCIGSELKFTEIINQAPEQNKEISQEHDDRTPLVDDNVAVSYIAPELKPIEILAQAPEQNKEISEEQVYRVLLVDDDELVRDLLKNGFQNEKCEITQAENGKIAIELLRKAIHLNLAKPDIIVLDVNMPEMNGFEVLEILKKDADLQSIPVIMLTRRDEDENVMKGISSGVLDYITKPFDVTDLVRRIVGTIVRHKIKILVADDDELTRDMLRQHFYSMGYQVLTTQSGIETMERLQTDKPDIAILDIMMPGMDGLSILKQTKANLATADIPIILLSAKSQQENILKGLESGAHDYITKPFDIDEVSARVMGILRRNKVA